MDDVATIERFSYSPYDDQIKGSPTDDFARGACFLTTDTADEWRAAYAELCDRALLDAYRATPAWLDLGDGLVVAQIEEVVVGALLDALERRAWERLMGRVAADESANRTAVAA